MKTPRELLLERHAATEPRLDALRRAVLDEFSAAPVPSAFGHSGASGWMRLLIASLRPLHRQLAAMGAIWVVALVLSRESSPASAPGSEVVRQGPPPAPRQILASLRENRRQLWELIQPPPPPPPAIPHAGVSGERGVPDWGMA